MEGHLFAMVPIYRRSRTPFFDARTVFGFVRKTASSLDRNYGDLLRQYPGFLADPTS